MVLKMGAARGCTARDLGCIMMRQGMGKSPIEKLHARAVELAAAPASSGRAASSCLSTYSRLPASTSACMAVDFVSDDAYLHHLEGVLEEYLEEILLEGLQSL